MKYLLCMMREEVARCDCLEWKKNCLPFGILSQNHQGMACVVVECVRVGGCKYKSGSKK